MEYTICATKLVANWCCFKSLSINYWVIWSAWNVCKLSIQNQSNELCTFQTTGNCQWHHKRWISSSKKFISIQIYITNEELKFHFSQAMKLKYSISTGWMRLSVVNRSNSWHCMYASTCPHLWVLSFMRFIPFALEIWTIQLGYCHLILCFRLIQATFRDGFSNGFINVYQHYHTQ